MKKKQYTLDTIHCAGCTYKIEDNINKINGVKNCNLSFITLKLTILYDEEIIDDIALLNKVNKCIDKSKIIDINDLPIRKDDLDLINEKDDSFKLRKRLFSKR